MAKESGLVALGLGIGAVALGGDYLINGPNSVIGKLLGKKKGFSMRHHVGGVPADPLYGENRYGQTSVGNRFPGWVYPVKTARAPFPALIPDTSGRVKIPLTGGYPSRHMAQEMAAESVADLVFNDASYFSPTEKSEVGTSVELKHRLLRLIRSPDAPEILRRLVEFHERHGVKAHDRGSPIYDQERELASSCADMYENWIGLEKVYSREGFAYAGEYDEENNRLSAAGAKSPIQFNIGGAYWNQ